MYDAVNDSRTRPQHLEWDGLVLPVDHSFWQIHGPPNELGWRPFGLTQAPAQDPTPHPRRKVKRGFPTPTNSHLFQPRLTKSPEFSERPMRDNSRSEGTRPVRSGLPPPPSSLANLYRDETRAGFPYSFRGFCRSRCNTRRARQAKRPALSVPVSSPDFRGERLRQREDPSVR